MRDPPAHLGRTSRLERVIPSLPDMTRADLGAEVHTVELFEDVLHFMGDELDGIRRRRHEDVRGDEHTVLTFEDRSSVEGRATLRFLQAQRDTQAIGGGQSSALAPERQ